jgi:hypothetical protein
MLQLQQLQQLISQQCDLAIQLIDSMIQSMSTLEIVMPLHKTNFLKMTCTLKILRLTTKASFRLEMSRLPVSFIHSDHLAAASDDAGDANRERIFANVRAFGTRALKATDRHTPSPLYTPSVARSCSPSQALAARQRRKLATANMGSFSLSFSVEEYAFAVQVQLLEQFFVMMCFHVVLFI